MGLAQQGVQSSKEQVASDIITGYTEEQRIAQAKQQTALSTINTMIDNGVFADTPSAAILALEKAAGLQEGTALAWQARMKILQKEDDQKSALSLQRLQLDIQEAQKRLTDSGSGSGTGTGAFSSNAIDILQDGINNGRTPAEAARDVASVYENMGIPVTQKQLNDWTVSASKLTKQVAPVDASTTTQPKALIYPQGPSSAGKVDINTRFSQLQQTMINPYTGKPWITNIKQQLIRENYPITEVNKLAGDIFDKIGAASTSFFGNLFK